jgi:nicotinate-nucleotide pyrophosphorylase (carboxylating)
MKQNQIKELVTIALQEDLYPNDDLTSSSLMEFDQNCTFVMNMREAGVIAGLEVCEEVFRQVDPEIQWSPCCKNGDYLEKGQPIANISGSGFNILKAERLALNYIQRLSGIATLTHKMVEKAKTKNPKVKVVDTRKTTPGLRLLEKEAVRCGGGFNHRFNLSDAVMIKDNHLAICKASGIPIEKAVETIKRKIPHTIKIEMEADTIEQVEFALKAEVDIVLLDNMSLDELKHCVKIIDKQAIAEASGGVNINTIADIAETGVDVISVGALTHSARALDIGLDWR